MTPPVHDYSEFKHDKPWAAVVSQSRGHIRHIGHRWRSGTLYQDNDARKIKWLRFTSPWTYMLWSWITQSVACKIFNWIITLEQIPGVLNEGFVTPVHKEKGKDPFLPGSYRGITLSSVIIKPFEIMILHRLTPVLEEADIPAFTQTAYQWGITCWCHLRNTRGTVW